MCVCDSALRGEGERVVVVNRRCVCHVASHRIALQGLKSSWQPQSRRVTETLSLTAHYTATCPKRQDVNQTTVKTRSFSYIPCLLCNEPFGSWVSWPCCVSMLACCCCCYYCESCEPVWLLVDTTNSTIKSSTYRISYPQRLKGLLASLTTFAIRDLRTKTHTTNNSSNNHDS